MRFLSLLVAATVASALVLSFAPLTYEPKAALAQSSLPPVPAGWPSSTLQLGQFDSPGGASRMPTVAPFGFRYQYLSGGVNTGGGWATWNPNGQFATLYIQESVANGITPVFTYYQLRQSAPGSTSDDGTANVTNLGNTSTMTAYYNDLKLLFQRAGAFPSTRVIVHFEPDLWGFLQQRATGDNAASLSARVAATGMPELSGLPDTAAGFAQAAVRLRDRYAPNVVLAYHLSVWGTGNDIVYTNPSTPTVDSLATRSGNFYLSLGANFDLSFADWSDRDAGFKAAQWGDTGAWWDAGDFARNVRYLTTYGRVIQKRIVVWQIPFGNTRMRAVNNTWNHYQDNHVEWILDDPSRGHLNEYLQAGVIAFLFGRGSDGVTCNCDANRDGVTNPAPINGNDRVSINSDDDGGFFKEKAGQYYSGGAMPLPFAGAPSTPTATPTRTPLPATTTPTRTLIPATATTTRTSAPATATPTRTPVPATATRTSTPQPPPATPTRTPTRTATPTSGSTTTVTFDDRAGQDTVLTGQYPSGVIDWGTSGAWEHSEPWGRFTTKSVGFSERSISSASFTFVTPRRLISLRAYNGRTTSATVTISCPGQSTTQVTLAADQVATIVTKWTGPCSTVTIATTNDSGTNFDNLVLRSG